jgi:hypothetical protein
MMMLGAIAVTVGVFWSSQVVLPPQPDSPTAADKAVLKQVAAKCHLPEGTLYFVGTGRHLSPSATSKVAPKRR